MTTASDSQVLSPATGGSSWMDRLLGLFGGLMVLGAVVVLVVGGPQDGATTAAAPPPLALLEPADGEVVGSRVPLVFHVDGDLRQQPGGWGVGGFHLHARVGDREFMPAPQDIERIDAGRYRWTIGPLEPGALTVRLLWSDRGHRPVAGGSTPAVGVRVE